MNSEDIFLYKGQDLESLHIRLYGRYEQPDGKKYLVTGVLKDQGIEVELVKTYHSGMMVVNSPEHVKFLAERVGVLYGDKI